MNKTNKEGELKKIATLNDYAGRSKKEWIKWAESEIIEYEKFLKFLKDE